MPDTREKENREQLLVRWMRDYGTALLRMCVIYLSDAALAEDALQDTFLKAWKSMAQFEGRNGCSEKSWLISIAINTCRDLRRSRWFRHVDSSRSLEELPPKLVSLLPEENDLLLDIARLPDKYKTVILLYYYQDMTQQEIADILGISRPVVARRLSKALNLLKDALGEEDCDEHK